MNKLSIALDLNSRNSLENKELTYFTLAGPSEFLHKVLGSKHIAHAIPVTEEEEIKEHLNKHRKDHHSATHVCYAWKLKNGLYRFSDDGEPSGTAGKPIFNQLNHFKLSDTLVIVIRYFGGTKLGSGGLMDAYKQAAKGAIEAAIIIEKPLLNRLTILFDYPQMPQVMALVKQYEAIRITFVQDLRVELVVDTKINLTSPFLEELVKIENVKAFIV